MVNNTTNTTDCGDNVFIIIVAAGSGIRFGSKMPKQFLPLNGKPVLMHAVDTFRATLPNAKIVLVLSDNGMNLWSEICPDRINESLKCVTGGDTRSHSVKNAISAIADNFNDNSIVLVHDGARPLVNSDMITDLVANMRRCGTFATVPIMPLTEALAMANDTCIVPTDRTAYCSVQTPQAFNANTLKTAYDLANDATMADDAAIVAKYTDTKIACIPGHPQNIKITNPNDIEIAEIYLRAPMPYKK